MRVLIVDDESTARARLKRLIGANTSVRELLEAEDGEEAVKVIAAQKPDVVLLDIQMPRLDGFGVVDAFGPKMPLTIFCTAYDEHALRAFEARAVDYLLKPVQADRLDAALERAKSLLSGPAAARRKGSAATSAMVEQRGEWLRRLVLHEGERAFLVSLDEIDFIRADRNYCEVRIGTRRLRLRRSLRSLEGRLDPERFLRINKSDIVRLDAVREIQPWSHGDYRMILRDGSTLSWSRRYRAAHPL